MSVRVPAAFCLLCLVFTRIVAKTTVSFVSSTFIQGHTELVTCSNACDSSGRFLRCEMRRNDVCQSVKLVVCLPSAWRFCNLDVIEVACDEEIEAKCENLIDKYKAWYRASRMMRRDISKTGKAAMATSSGNGHAFAYDGNTLVESHNGGPPTFYNPPNGMNFGFPFAFPPMPTQPMPMLQPYPGVASPFQNIFHSVGLEDPMTMLQGSRVSASSEQPPPSV